LERETKEQLLALIENCGPNTEPDAIREAINGLLGAPQVLTATVEEMKPLEMVLTVSPQLADLQKRRPLDIPAEWVHLVSPEQLADTINQLNGTGQGLVEAGNAKALASSGKGNLLKQKRQLETAIKLTEAEALMKIKGTGKDATGELNGVVFPCGTEQLKDAFRRNASKVQRQELADVEGDIMKLEGDAISKTDDWNTAKEAAENARARAFLQGHILAYMAPRG